MIRNSTCFRPERRYISICYNPSSQKLTDQLELVLTLVISFISLLFISRFPSFVDGKGREAIHCIHLEPNSAALLPHDPYSRKLDCIFRLLYASCQVDKDLLNSFGTLFILIQCSRNNFPENSLPQCCNFSWSI